MSAVGLDIKRRIDLNNKLIEDALKPNQFTLNNTVGYIIEIMGYGFTYKILSFVILGAIIVYSFILCLKKPKICEKTM